MKQINNEIKFLGQSFVKGFLSFYGLELDNAVKDYEQRLHIIEQVDLNNSQHEYYLGTVKNNDLKLVNKNNPIASKEEAEEILQKVSEPKKEQDRSLSAELERKQTKKDED